MLDDWNRAHREYDILDAQYKVALDRQKGLLASKARSERELDRVPVALELLQALYDRVSGALISSCETAMTDAVRAIIGDETIIGIEAKYHRNQTKVSIGTALNIKDGSRVLRDIVRDEGGGLTNVVTMILRMIAVGRSGQRRFIILDEPDCFLNPSQITPFFEIIKDMVDKAGFQIILLTHHTQSMSCFGDDVNVITFSHGAGRVEAYATHEAGNPERTDIIHGVRMQNFGKHEDLYIPLIAGLNVITGPSNVGKSRILAAMRCVLGDDGSDSVLHASEDEDGFITVAKSCTVTIDFDNDKQVVWKRRKSGSPVETWDFLYKGNAVTLEDGTLCCGKNGSDWAGRPECLNMRAISGLWPALHLQKMPVFALEDGAALADLLSISQTSIHLKSMIAVTSDRKKAAERDLREARQELDVLSKSIHWMNASLSSLRDTLDIGDAALSDYEARRSTMETLTTLANKHSESLDLMACGARTVSAVDVAIPDLDDVQGAIDLLIDYDDAAFMEWAGRTTATVCAVQTPDLVDVETPLKAAFDYAEASFRANRAEAICKAASVALVEIAETEQPIALYQAYQVAYKKGSTQPLAIPVQPQLKETAPLSHAFSAYSNAKAQMHHGALVEKAVSHAKEPVLSDTATLESLLAAYRVASSAVKAAAKRTEQCEQDMARLNTSIEAQRAALGVCPLCGRA